MLSAVLTAGIVKALGAGSAFEKYLRYVCALLLTLGLLSPLRSLLQAELPFPDFTLSGDESNEEQVPDAFLRQFEYATEEAASALLEKELSLGKDACSVRAFARDENGLPRLMRLEVTVRTLKGAAATGKIRERLEQTCGCEVQVREDIG